MVREFLDERGVAYEVMRVARDAKTARAFQTRGWRLPPVVEVDDVAVEGFQPERLEELFGGRA